MTTATLFQLTAAVSAGPRARFRQWALVTAPALVCLVLLITVAADAQQCPVVYDTNTQRPLLFGGVQQGCRSGCQSRADTWSRRCTQTGDYRWGVCTQQQTDRVIGFARTVDNGAAVGLSPCEVIKYLEGRTLWLIGDSDSTSFYRALQCFLIDFWGHQECESSTNAQAVQELTSLTYKAGRSKCFHLLGDLGGRVCLVYAVLATQLAENQQIPHGGILPLLRDRFAQPSDIFYINTGYWHRKTTDLWNTYKPGLEALGRYYQSNQGSWPHLLFREVPANHQRDTKKQYCMAAQGLVYNTASGQLDVTNAAAKDKQQQWQLGQITNNAAADVLSRYSVPIVPSFSISVPLHDVHAGQSFDGSGMDCLHYCSPGVPEIWIYYMYRAFSAGITGIKPMRWSGNNPQKHTCIPSYTYQ